jgi:hypothetical protein
VTKADTLPYANNEYIKKIEHDIMTYMVKKFIIQIQNLFNSFNVETTIFSWIF